MDDYVPVNERIEQFYNAFPEGSLESEIVELTERRVTVKAYAYRKPDDPRPGIGHSSLTIPGSTPYTRGSEIENAETSAWGRAIAALGFEVKRGIASAEEIRNKSNQPPSPASSPRSATVEPARELSPASATPSFDDLPPEEPFSFDDVLAITGGTEVQPDPIKERIARAEAKGAQKWVCPVHGTSKVIPAGVSKKTGRPYEAFTACGETGCNEKPARRAA